MLCECGCGGTTGIAQKSGRGYLIGEPLRFLKGHHHPGNRKHGHSTGYKESPTLSTWHNMKQRCLNAKSQGFARYGGRGIKVCERWLEFANFLADMGVKPPGTYIDRIDNDGNYEPSNCHWVTPKESAQNRKNGHPNSPETRRKISLSKIGKPQTAESNLKRSMTQKGRPRSPESLEKFRLTIAKRRAQL